jgi:putative ABC transport system substrate-binding protein
MHRVAFVAMTSRISELTGADPINPAARAFLHGLHSLGYIEGQNLVMEWRSAEGRFERFPEIIRELVTIKADVIVTFSIPPTRAAKQITQKVPIVTLVDNPGGRRACPELGSPRWEYHRADRGHQPGDLCKETAAPQGARS